jgi:hypothetical protein
MLLSPKSCLFVIPKCRSCMMHRPMARDVMRRSGSQKAKQREIRYQMRSTYAVSGGWLACGCSWTCSDGPRPEARPQSQSYTSSQHHNP